MTKSISNIIYLSPRDVRKNRADAVHIMYSCAAFSNLGIEVELVAPTITRTNFELFQGDVFALYDVPNNFKITELKTKIKEVNNRSSALVLGINRLVFSFLYLLKNFNKLGRKDVMIYSKCYTSIIPYIFFRRLGLIKSRLVFETPFLNKNRYHKFIMKQMDAVVVMTSFVENFLIETFKIDSQKVIKCPIRFQTDYAVDQSYTKSECRTELNWDNKTKYILYAGKASPNLKRIKVFAEASKNFDQVKFVIVGATQALIDEYSDKAFKNLILYPFQSYSDYLKFTKASDVLVATYEDTFYNRYTLSPGKGGAYLLSGNPVVFSDLPCLRDRFPENLVSFVETNSAQHLEQTVEHILTNYETFTEEAKNAEAFVRKRSFTNAADYITKRLNEQLY